MDNIYSTLSVLSENKMEYTKASYILCRFFLSTCHISLVVTSSFRRLYHDIHYIFFHVSVAFVSCLSVWHTPPKITHTHIRSLQCDVIWLKSVGGTKSAINFTFHIYNVQCGESSWTPLDKMSEQKKNEIENWLESVFVEWTCELNACMNLNLMTKNVDSVNGDICWQWHINDVTYEREKKRHIWEHENSILSKIMTAIPLDDGYIWQLGVWACILCAELATMHNLLVMQTEWQMKFGDKIRQYVKFIFYFSLHLSLSFFLSALLFLCLSIVNELQCRAVNNQIRNIIIIIIIQHNEFSEMHKQMCITNVFEWRINKNIQRWEHFVRRHQSKCVLRVPFSASQHVECAFWRARVCIPEHQNDCAIAIVFFSTWNRKSFLESRTK